MVLLNQSTLTKITRDNLITREEQLIGGTISITITTSSTRTPVTLSDDLDKEMEEEAMIPQLNKDRMHELNIAYSKGVAAEVPMIHRQPPTISLEEVF